MAQWSKSPHSLKEVVKNVDIGDVAGKLRENIVDTLLHNTPSGRTYYIGDRTHIASAPGQPPAPFTFNLANSVNEPIPTSGGFRINIDVPYASYLETGTREMRPRPFIGPSIKKTIDDLNKKRSN